jgi:excisionase family DNA binding protein
VSGSLLLSVRDAARHLGIGRDSAYELVRTGRLRSVEIGRRRLVPVAELEAFVGREASGEAVMPMAIARSGDDETPGRSDAEVS